MNILDIFRKAVLPMMLATAIMTAQAQGTYVCNETFGKNTPQGWSVQPAYSAQAPTWRTEKWLVVSASYAAHGYVVPVSVFILVEEEVRVKSPASFSAHASDVVVKRDSPVTSLYPTIENIYEQGS